MENQQLSKTETITLAGGCFWCAEAVFQQLRGVEQVTSGYMGGLVKAPSYEAVCSGMTKHAEVVQIVFREDEISFQRLLEVFFAIHDPTTLNRQGNDVGTQYRSVVFVHGDDQRQFLAQAIARLEAEKAFAAPIITAVEPASVFYPAEDYHQDYFHKNPQQGYCDYVVAPKVAKFQQAFAPWLKPLAR